MAFQDWALSGSRNDSLCILLLLSGSDAGGGTVGIGKTAVSSPPPPLHSDSGSNGHFTIYTVTLFLPGLRENYEVDTFLVWLHHGHSMTLSKDAVL